MKNEITKKVSYYIIAKYKPDKNNEDKVKILDEDFIKRNKNKVKLIYKNKIFELKEYFEDIDINYNHKDVIKLRIKFINNIIDMSYMFYNCDSLISLSDNNETDINCLFLIMHIINIHGMFYGCKSLISIPDTSKWNTSKIICMHGMFYGCKSLRSLPDISEWNISNVENVENIFLMFFGCESLISLPDISKWETSNNKIARFLFIIFIPK